jgi:3-phenylpropionate/trans-cinnamate dioxygenase ferredoxin component
MICSYTFFSGREVYMKYVIVAQITELRTGNKKKITIDGKEILLTNIQDEFFAIDNTCSHMGGSLYDGDLDNNHIKCPKHGSVFNVKTGKLVKSGKMLFINVKAHDLQSYPVKIEGTDIMLGIE